MDDFGILLVYGADCIGAVSVHGPDGSHTELNEDRLDELTRAAVTARKTVSGIQPKLLATKRGRRFVAAEPMGRADYIAKFSSDDLPSLVLNEDISLKAARILLGNEQVTVAGRGFIEGIPDAALLVKRFDRTDTNEKLCLEDFAQILCRPRGQDFMGKYDASFEDGAGVIERHSARVEIDRLNYFRRIAAFALLGNCDSHLKNFSLLETPAGLRLSPAYDVVNTYVYARQGYSTRFGLRMAGETRQFEAVDRSLLTDFGRRIGVTDKAIVRTYDGFAKRRARVLKLVEPSSASDNAGFFALYADTVRSAYIRICGE